MATYKTSDGKEFDSEGFEGHLAKIRADRHQEDLDNASSSSSGSRLYSASEVMSQTQRIKAANMARNNYNSDVSDHSSSSSYDDEESSSSSSSKKFNIIGAIVCAVVGSFILGFPIGTIIGAVAGWFLGRFLANKFLAIVIIVGLIGGGIYFGRSHIEPLVVSVTGKSNLFAKTSTQTVSANVNFRAEPSTDAVIIRTLNQGDVVTVTGTVQGGWSQVSNNGDTGWVSTEFLK